MPNPLDDFVESGYISLAFVGDALDHCRLACGVGERPPVPHQKVRRHDQCRALVPIHEGMDLHQFLEQDRCLFFDGREPLLTVVPFVNASKYLLDVTRAVPEKTGMRLVVAFGFANEAVGADDDIKKIRRKMGRRLGVWRQALH